MKYIIKLEFDIRQILLQIQKLKILIDIAKKISFSKSSAPLLNIFTLRLLILLYNLLILIRIMLIRIMRLECSMLSMCTYTYVRTYQICCMNKNYIAFLQLCVRNWISCITFRMQLIFSKNQSCKIICFLPLIKNNSEIYFSYSQI